MKNKAGLIGIIITIVILIVVVIISNISTGNLSFVEGAVGTIFVPIQNGIVFLKNKITGNDQENSDIASVDCKSNSANLFIPGIMPLVEIVILLAPI